MRSIRSLIPYLLAITFFATNSTASAQSQPAIDWTMVHTKAMTAIDHLYNLRFDESEKVCNDLISYVPQDPRGHFFKAMIYYYRHEIINKNKANYDRFNYYAQNAINVCENILKYNENDAKATFYLGGLYGYKGILRFNAGEQVKALYEGKKGLDYLEKSVKLDPNNPDVQMGYGLFQYLTSRAPSFVKNAMKLAGMTAGDANVGLRMLENAAQNGLYAKHEAQRWLADFWNWEENYNRSAFHWKSLSSQFPDNAWYHLGYAGLCLSNYRRADEAITTSKRILTLNIQEESKRAIGRAYNLIGIANLYQGDYKEAGEWFRKCITFNSDSSLIASCHWNMGRTLELSGNRSEAVLYFSKSGRTATEYAPMDAKEIELLKAENAFRAGDYMRGVQLGGAFIQRTDISEDQKARAMYSIGRCFHESGNYVKAEEFYKYGVQTKPTSTWLHPYLWYRMGLSQAKIGNKSVAKQSFQTAQNYDSYDGADYIKRSAEKEMYRLK